MDKTLQGSVLVLIQFDVCEEIKLDALRDIFGARRQEAASSIPLPDMCASSVRRWSNRVEPLILESGERLDVQIKYYDYGVLSVVFELPFSGDWDTLVRLAGRWVWDTDFTSFAQKIVKQKIERARPALVKLYDSWLHEDYFVFHVRDLAGNPSAAELLAAEGGRIAQIVRGENMPLSDGEQPGNHAVADLLLSERPGGDQLERSVPLRHRRPARKPSSSCSNTPTRSCSSSATTTNC